MTEIVMGWPWYDRVIAFILLFGAAWAPWVIVRGFERVQQQNERIIRLLANIRDGLDR